MEYEKLAELLELAKQGDEDAFTQIYYKLSKTVYYMSMRIIKNEQDADDMAQEVMTTLYTNLHNIKNPKALVAYVNRITSYRCADFLRKNSRAQMVHDPEQELLNLINENEEFIPEDYLLKKEKREYIVGLIDELSDDHRTVITLFYYNKLSINQIVDLIKSNEATIKKRLSRARNVLKEKMLAGMKGMVFAGAPVVSLSRLLEMDATETFTTEISAKIWQKVAENIGYSPAIIAATMSTATTGTAVVAPAAATTVTSAITAAIAASPALKVAVVAAVAAPVITASVYINEHIITPMRETRQQSVVEQYVDESPAFSDSDVDIIPSIYSGSYMPSDPASFETHDEIDAFYYSIDITNGESDDDDITTPTDAGSTESHISQRSNEVSDATPIETTETTYIYEELISSELPETDNEVTDAPTEVAEEATEITDIATEDEPTEDEAPDESSEPTNYPTKPTDTPTEVIITRQPAPPIVDEESSNDETTGQAPPPPTDSPTNPILSPPYPSIETAQTRLLNFPTSTIISAEQILAMLEITAINPDGSSAPVYLDFFEEVDWDTPGMYVVFIRAVGNIGWSSHMPVVIVVG